MKIQYRFELSKDSYSVHHTTCITQEEVPGFQVDCIGHYRAYPQYYTEREGLNMYLLLYTISGRGYMKYRGEEYSLTENTVSLIDCSEYQHYGTRPGETWEFRYIHFYGKTADQYYRMLEERRAEFMEISDPSQMDLLFHRMRSQAEQSGRIPDLRISSIMESILTELLVEQQYEKNALNIRYQEEVMRLMEYLKEHYQENLSVDQMAERVSMSKYHFIRVFKQITGVSPYEYLKILRMNESKKMLKETDYSIGQIADFLGYSNVNLYIQNFKKCVGLTPLQYRKRAL